MPLLTVKTNISAKDDKEVLDLLTESVAKLTGKPKGYVSVIIEDEKKMAFGGTLEPCAMIQLGRSVSLFTVVYFSTCLSFLSFFSFCPRRTVFVGGLCDGPDRVVCRLFVCLKPSHIFGTRLQNLMKLCWCCL